MKPLLESDLDVVSVGAPLFADTLEAQQVAVERIDWRPPAEGDPELSRLLGRLWRPDVDARQPRGTAAGAGRAASLDRRAPSG